MQSPTRLSSKSIGKNPASTRQHVQFPDQLACERSAYRPAHGPDRYQPPTVKLPAPRLNRVRPDSTKPRLQSATAVVAARWDGDGRGLPNSRNRPAPTTAKMAWVTNAGILVPSRVISAAAPKCPADTATVYTNNERPFMAPKLRLPKYAPRMANPSGASPPDPIPISIADAKTTASPSLTTAQASDSTTPSARADEKPNTAFRMATRSPISPPMSIPTTLAPACTSPASAHDPSISPRQNEGYPCGLDPKRGSSIPRHHQPKIAAFHRFLPSPFRFRLGRIGSRRRVTGPLNGLWSVGTLASILRSVHQPTGQRPNCRQRRQSHNHRCDRAMQRLQHAHGDGKRRG